MKYSEWKRKTIVEPAEKEYNIFINGVLSKIKELPSKVNKGSQGKHIRGSHNFDETRSELTVDPEELYKLYSGKGTHYPRKRKTGEWKNKEVFEHTSVIGLYYDISTGERTQTNRGTIHYSTSGWHIVPARPKVKRNDKKV